MNQAELFNIYVDKLSNSVSELTKSNILLSAQISYYEKINSELNSKVDELQKSLEKALNKVDSKSKKSDTEF
jgi:chaperonin cofactor prefoldin